MRKLLCLALLAGCTVQQRQLIKSIQEVKVDPISVVATCDRIDFTISNLPVGTQVFVTVGSQPPFGFTMLDSSYSNFITLPSWGYEVNHGYEFVIETDHRLFNKTVVCP